VSRASGGALVCGSKELLCYRKARSRSKEDVWGVSCINSSMKHESFISRE
jgi:hypothetical protein